ncbi:MAG: O-antigen ligase family protein [Chloroflexi bacterium]|nr:O-antigen ligase family protein [Chloroflexota bacterium]
MKNTNPAFLRLVEFGSKLAMGLVVLSLPITSLPLLSKVMGGTQVAPASAIFILLLAVGWTPVYLLRGGALPAEMKPFLLFVIAAMVSLAAAFFLPLPPYKDYSILNAEMNALIALIVGCVTYLIVAIWHRDLASLTTTLQLVNVSGIIILVWSFIELAIILFRGGNYPSFMEHIQALISTRPLYDLGFRTRVGGFTYEPSWLAHQLNLVYLPYWLAATVTGYSATKKILRISVENILLAGGIVILYFTISRIGLLAFLLTVAFVFYRLNAYLVRWLRNRLQGRSLVKRWRLDRLLPLLLGLVVFIVYAGGVGGLLVMWAHLDPRTARLLSLEALPSNLFDFAFKVDFAERVIYWSIGWSVFARYPLLGVGLGNTGFFFLQYIPNLSYRLPEIINVAFLANTLPNTKSFWVRLLAETGLIGFSLVAAWQVVLWKGGAFLRSTRSALFRTLGWMGAFAILAFLAEGFSIDSFALPYLWFAMGLLTAASAFARQDKDQLLEN